MPQFPAILHLLTGVLPDERAALLRRLLAAPANPRTHHLLHLGPGVPPPLSEAIVHQVHAAGPGRVGRSLALSRAVRRLPRDAARPWIVQVWTRAALAWCSDRALPAGGRLVDLPPDADVAAWLRDTLAAGHSDATLYACPHGVAEQGLVQRGVPVGRIVRIPPLVPGAATADRVAGRRRLALEPAHRAILALPPVTRSSGALIATWAALLVQKVEPRVRMILPAAGPDVERVRRLVAACRHGWMVRFASPDMSLAALLSIADLAICLPDRAASVVAVLAACQAGVPLVVSTARELDEFVQGIPHVWRCRPRDPADAARGLLAALDAPAPPAQARPRPETTESEVLGAYAAAYTRLATLG